VIGNERARQLLDVVGRLDFGEQIPFHGALVEGIEDGVAALGIEEPTQIAASGSAMTARSPRASAALKIS
jgi:hypothetical protein